MAGVGEILGYVPLALVLGVFAYGITISGRGEKAAKLAAINKKEDEKREKAKAISIEVDMVNRAASMLPDVNSALNLLRENYGWLDITKTIDVHGLELEFMRTIWAEGLQRVTLPNMQSDHFGSLERNVANVVNSFTTESDDVPFWGFDTYAQELTVGRLRELVDAGYVGTTEAISKNVRDYDCVLTLSGWALMELDNQFCRGETERSCLPRHPCTEALKIVARVLHRSIALKASS